VYVADPGQIPGTIVAAAVGRRHGTGPADRENTMKAFVRTQYGPPGVLEFEDVDDPVLKDDEVLVRVHASSLNQGDLDYLYGKPFLTRMGIGLRAPRHRGLGFDAAGNVRGWQGRHSIPAW
jgi:hypothetical protein